MSGFEALMWQGGGLLVAALLLLLLLPRGRG